MIYFEPFQRPRDSVDEFRTEFQLTRHRRHVFVNAWPVRIRTPFMLLIINKHYYFIVSYKKVSRTSCRIEANVKIREFNNFNYLLGYGGL